MQMLDCRRLTGPSLVWSHAGAILDVAGDDSECEWLSAVWQQHARNMLDAVGWTEEQTAVHPLTGGVSLLLSAPPDALYAATEICEWAWTMAVEASREHADKGTADDSAESFEAAALRLRELIAGEQNPALLALRDAAAERSVAFASDDDFVSVGQGSGSQLWPVTGLPAPAAVDWSRVHDIPVALITGTNGKTTTVRLAASIMRAAGLAVGVSSTDWVAVNDEIIDRGDYSGPGGARTALRDRRVEAAVLETARGGLLRRGLGVDKAAAALITNISADHIGDFGCRDLHELLDVKWTVSRSVEHGGRLVLNADDPLLVERGRGWAGSVAWFGLEQDALAAVDGVEKWSLRDGCIGVERAARWQALCAVEEVPVTLNGAATHNVANALAAAAVCAGAGFDNEHIAAGLRAALPANNPGRTDLMQINGRHVLVDFAHNPAAVRAVLSLASKLPARRRLVAFSEAGDRPDALLRELAGAVWAIRPDRVALSELADYRRGREPGEVAAVLRAELLERGASEEQIGYCEREIDTVRAAVEWSQPGDVLVLLILGEQQTVYEYLRSL